MTNYRDRLKKTIKLPSGVSVAISKLNAFNAPFLEKNTSDDNQTAGVRISKFILLNKVGAIDGLKIVETVADSRTEIAITEIEQADIDEIVSQVLDFSELGKRDEGARKTFPEAGSQNGHQRAQTGADLPRTPADGVAENAAVRVATTQCDS